MNVLEILLSSSKYLIQQTIRKHFSGMTYFIWHKRQSIEEEICVIANLTAKPRLETLLVKSEPVDVVDIKSEKLDVVAIKTEPFD